MSENNNSYLKKCYQYTDLKYFNLLVYMVMLCSMALTIVGIIHGIYTLILISDIQPTQLLLELSQNYQTLIAFDDQLRPIQIASIVVLLMTIFWLWLYYARRNSCIFHQDIDKDHRYVVKEAMTLSVGIFFTIAMMTQLISKSAVKVSSNKNLRPLVLMWWVVFIAANLSKITSLYLIYQVQTIAMWKIGHYWMMLAYILYFILYILTYSFIHHVTLLQRSQLNHI